MPSRRSTGQYEYASPFTVASILWFRAGILFATAPGKNMAERNSSRKHRTVLIVSAALIFLALLIAPLLLEPLLSRLS